MKHMRKLLAMVLAVMMVMSLATTAFAQTENVGNGNGSITIKNPSKGETYGLIKLFDATVSADNKSIAYTGTIPAELASVFVKDTAGNIMVADGVSKEDVISAVQSWAEKQTFQNEIVSDGTELTFSNLQYGYYVVESSQGTVVTIDSTMPNAEIYDKNTSKVTPPVKAVDDDNVKIGDTVTYTVEFNTANYDEDGKIISYTIHDTLPEFLSNVAVTSITVDGTAINPVPQFNNKQIVIDWVNDQGNHLYRNGAKIVITYTATVTDEAAIDGAGNTNEVSLTWNNTDGPVTPDDPDQYKDSVTIYTYALALKKVNNEGNALSGATFQFPFYVKETPDTEDGAMPVPKQLRA